ncbi:BMP family lipoprotein [Stomatohabitans albus]|uniref:BMP family lipoprotein n=1 Tax=Stomatohabitans albus TaxID=3110766 RepID=UPI00300D04D5
MVSTRFVVPVAACLVLAGCAGGTTTSDGSESTEGGSEAITPLESSSTSADASITGEPPSIVSVLNGPLGDDAFFDDVEQGLHTLADQGWETKTVEAPLNDPVSWKANLEAASNGDYDLVVVGTIQMADILQTVAPAHPNQHYVIWDMVVDAPNVTSITYAQNEGSYLAGVLAAKASQDTTAFPKSEGNNRVGIVAGMESPVIDDFIGGFKAGVASVSPDMPVDVAYVGSFTDANAGAQQAKAMYDQGVDVIYAIAGGASLGVAHAAKEADDYAIGVDLNMNPVEPGFVLASMVKQIGRSISDTSNGLKDGTVQPGTVQVIGLDAGLGLTYEGNNDAVPDTVKKELDQTATDIIDGKITVPSALNGQ